MRILSAFILFSLLLTGCYIPKTLVYQLPGIYDYKIFKNREIEKGDPQPIPESVRYNKVTFPEKYLNDITQISTTAFLVLKNDSVVFEQYWVDGGKDVLSNSFSMAKSFVGILIGFAIQDGYIQNVNEKVSKYIPGFERKGKENIRIVDLLTMSSGIKWHEGYSGLFGPTTVAYYGKNLKKMIRKLKLESNPGERFYYQSIDTEVLALIIENATGKKLSDYASEKIWKPVGAEHAALWSLDWKKGLEKAYCCINATARDFARFGIFCSHNGSWKGKQLLNADYVKKCFEPASYLKDRKDQPLSFYGYQCWTTVYENMKVNMAIGLGGQYIIMIPELQTIIVRLGHKRSSKQSGQFPEDFYTVLKAGLEISDSIE